ncbi:large ribosomal subunit protein uL10m [Lepisosteus oculatus]|nr:PREDICTED: 39S ribosomal protein L10, mitochondrial [Lepisosteus oculatus]XP_015217840.1 PREDICTED: 39S ribosomal protein L10, mitochondrial [Lepisosteus oculatus]
MAATLCGRLLPRLAWLPARQSVRHGSKAVTRHRKPVHFLKQKLLAVTEYRPPRPAVPERCIAPPARQTQEESSLARILEREVEAMFQEGKMIAVVQNNATSAEDMLLFKSRLHKHGIAVRFYPNQVMRSFLSESRYRNLSPLFIGQNVLLVSKEPRVKEMLQCLKGAPQMVLLGACVEETLLSRQGVLAYSRLPSLMAVRGQLVGGMALMTSRTAALLQHHPARLSALLQQYQRQAGGGSTEESSKPEHTDLQEV